jgi:hypothetical protein
MSSQMSGWVLKVNGNAIPIGRRLIYVHKDAQSWWTVQNAMATAINNILTAMTDPSLFP